MEPKNRFLLDTNSYYGFIGTDKNIQDKIVNNPEYEIFLCEPVIAEILRRRLNTVDTEVKKATHGKSDLIQVYTHLYLDLQRINHFGKTVYDSQADLIYKEFRNKKDSPAASDCRIAAIARRYGLTLVTSNDKHMSILLSKDEFVDWSRGDTI